MNKIESIPCCFLILHYINIELTVKTIESILNLQDFENSKIVVVDNGSPNSSGSVLEEKYKEEKQVHIVLSSVNLGFSKGNNLGFWYIKNNFLPEFVIVINNDILFPQKEFIRRIKELYLEEPFWVAGPDILVTQRIYHSSPLYDGPFDREKSEAYIARWEIEKGMFSKMFSLWAFKYYIRDRYADCFFLKKFFLLRRFFQKSIKKYEVRRKNVVLQGACLIFDKRYCEKNKNLFLPLTFMYAEENILTRYCINNNWEIRYFPEIQVWHKEEGSSQYYKISYRKYCEKRIVKLCRLQEAYKIYIEQLCENG